MLRPFPSELLTPLPRHNVRWEWTAASNQQLVTSNLFPGQEGPGADPLENTRTASSAAIVGEPWYR